MKSIRDLTEAQLSSILADCQTDNDEETAKAVLEERIRRTNSPLQVAAAPQKQQGALDVLTPEEFEKLQQAHPAQKSGFAGVLRPHRMVVPVSGAILQKANQLHKPK